MIAALLRAGKLKILSWAFALTVLTTYLDGVSGTSFSLAALFIVPMMLGAIVLTPIQITIFAVVCSYLRSWFDVPGSPVELTLRFIFAALAYLVSGFFVRGLIQTRQQTLRHYQQIQEEQAKRREAEEQLQVLAESSPAGILTIDGDGTVLAANHAANQLFALPQGKAITGDQISKYLPALGGALRLPPRTLGLRTAAQAQGYRENGEIFQAHMWFSTYNTEKGNRLAAIVVDSSEEMREREEQGQRDLFAGNRIATAAIAHEVRNFCEAMTMLSNDLRHRHNLEQDEGLRGMDRLVGGLEAIASLELQPKKDEGVERIALQEVLDNLRIVVEPDWRDFDGTVQWDVPQSAPFVWAEPHGLLQAFLNLAQNSHRAVLQSNGRQLRISVEIQGNKVIIRFQDSGPGVHNPERLFQPFQEGAAGSGMGLYLSRSIVRGFGGELRYRAELPGACFEIELEKG